MFDYVDQLPSGIYKGMLKLISMFYDTCVKIYNASTVTISNLLQNLLQNFGLSEKWSEVITNFLEKPSNSWIFSATLGELILGGLLVSVLIFGIVKFFTDIIL